nr:type II toxin-antitoxin system RelE/ParE family toxin [uncultured Halomonas sp.]
MTRTSAVTFENTALQSLRNCRYFLVDHLEMPLDKAHTYTQSLADTAVSRLAQRADTYAICRQAAELGTNDYRELPIDNYRVVYRIWPETHDVSIYLFVHQRQDFKQLLFQYQMLK